MTEMDNNTKCMFCYDWRGGLVKVNAFHLRSTIIEMARTILVDVVSYLFYGWDHKVWEESGCSWLVFMRKGSSEDTKGAVFVILRK